MKKIPSKTSLFFIVALCFVSVSLVSAQRVILYEDDFVGENGKGEVGNNPIDTSGVSWSIDISSGIFENSQNFFIVGRIDSEVFEAQNVGGPVTWSSAHFPISGDDSLEFTFDALAETNAFESDDVFKVEIIIDGVSETLFEGTVPAGNNNDMSFGSTTLTPSLQTFSTPISGTGLDAVIRITCDTDNNAELLGWDNLQVTGIPTGPNVRWENTRSSVTETNSSQSIAIPVTLSLYEENVELDVAVTGGSAESSDYTLNTTTLNFTGNETQNVLLDIYDDPGFEDETIKLTLTENTTTDIDINPKEHTLTILDDEPEPAPTVFINELHYYEQRGDVTNFVEVALIETYTGSLSDISVYLYDGDDGTFYNSLSLNNFTAGSTSGGFDFYTWTPTSGINDGKNGPDGLALVFQETVIEFLSYEGTFMATNGPAAGSTSSNIGVEEPNNTDRGNSLQRTGSCAGENCPAGLNWVGPAPDSPGEANAQQLLPVQWLAFTATHLSDKSGVELSWSVAREENHDYYEVLYSINGADWQVLDRIWDAAREDSMGSNGLQKRYEYIHYQAAPGLNLYRIRQVDIDGAADYSMIRQLIVGGYQGRLQLAPNPAREHLYFSWPSDLQQQSVEMELISMQGQTQTLYRGEAPGQLRLPQMAAGMYQLLVRDASGRIISRQRVVIQ